MESIVVGLFLGKIISIIENEASLIGGVHDAVNELKVELEWMESILKDADQNKSLTTMRRHCVASVRDMCYPVEYIIEEFVYHLHRERQDGKVAKLLHGVIPMPKDFLIRRRVAKKIQGINKKLKSIEKRNWLDGGSQIHDDQTRAEIKSKQFEYVKDDNVVGIEDEKKQLLEWLKDGDTKCKVIFVVGMGGCGKSTLVAQVYHDLKDEGHFNCYSWVTVSQRYNIDDLLERIRSMCSTDPNQKPKKYLIVLDDVWDPNLSEKLKITLQDKNLGSRLILTTQNNEIANSYSGFSRHVLHVKPLEDREAWDLFCSTAFFNNENKACPEDIKSIATDLVRKCNGLPLAILDLGRAMSSKKMEFEWRDFQASLGHELSTNPYLEEVKKRIFLYSFNDLSYRLKQCFLYCCIFPGDYPIKRKRLVKLWMAEGFIGEVGGKTPEAVADNYLLQLVHRNMLQVVERNSHGRPKKCKMHDMMRELALSISKEEKFYSVYGSQEREREVSMRRLSIQTNSIPLNGISQLRSLFVFIRSSETNPLPSGFKVLRVLDLEDVPVEKLPKELVKLFNLRYLNLRGTKVKELPSSITKLRNLETLDIRDGEIEALPSGIVELKKLRHLKMYRMNRHRWFSRFDFLSSILVPCRIWHRLFSRFNFLSGILVPCRIWELKDLQTLGGVEAEPTLLKQIKGMTQLTSIVMTKVKREYEQDLCTAIGDMKLLRRITVMVTNENEHLAMDALSAAPPDLNDLFLGGKMEKVPSWFNPLPKLTRLHLQWSRLSEDPLPSIQSLPKLHDLTLINAYVGGQLCFSSGFSKLEKLYLEYMEQLDNVSIKEGVMPALKKLQIVNCKGLKRVPQGIEHLVALEELLLYSVSAELVESISGEQSEDRPRVRHIPNIIHSYEDEHTYKWVHENLRGLD